jgi:opacity protein-like surface antigen
MVRVVSFAVAGVLAGQAASAIAADMPGTTLPPPQPLQLTERRAVLPDLNSGWYLRGDLGAHWGVLSSAQSAPGFPDPTDSTLNQVATGSLGAGIKSGWLRTDVTIDYAAPMKYQGTFAAPDDTSAKIQATTALLNGYLDLGSWYRATPYIGGGIGVAYARVSDYQSGGAPPFSGATDKSQWNFAWAGMAGIAYAISHNMMIDVGYRYLNIGNVSTGSDAFGAMTFKNVAGHEVRVGLRWSFDELRYVQ